MKKHPNKKLALLWTIATAKVSFVGARLLGLAHTFPGVNLYIHGTLVTATHGRPREEALIPKDSLAWDT